MRVYSFYNNWVVPNDLTIKADFDEYKKKEKAKWESRAKAIGARWPLFKDIQHFKQSLISAKIVPINDNIDRQIHNRSRTQSLDDLKGLVSGYQMPRDVDRIVDGFENNARIPLPIVLRGQKGMWIMAGNTRLDVAGILGVPKKALLVDVSPRPMSAVVPKKKRDVQKTKKPVPEKIPPTLFK